jgi:polysaccharide deacetylase 2 family uncharacterized protein YibQ
MAKRKPQAKGRGLDWLFWGLVLFAVAVGGNDVLAGLPVIARMLLPQHDAPASHAPYANAEFDQAIDSRSPYRPEVLQPVREQPSPDWLKARRSAQIPARAGSPQRPLGKGLIAIVIDDMGGDVAQSRRAIALPKAITLSFLPYPETAPALARAALHEGHEILVHVPMEPIGTADPGPNALRTDIEPAENQRRLTWDLERIAGFDGINNHEGSKFTADRAALTPIIGILADRGVFFLDSRTSPQTQVVATARAFGVASAGRDVFLDDADSPEAIDRQLHQAETVADQQGVVIAIGHPRTNTLDALWRWSGEIASRGYTLIPVRDAIRLKTEREMRGSSLAATRR